MKIEDLIQLLNNRLREFQLSRDYAKMNGDLERMNAADKEVIALEDTLYKLNLLADASKSAAVKESTLAEVMTDGSVAVLGEYDISPYATDPLHEEKIMTILSNMGVMDTVEKIDAYIKNKYLSSPVTGEMIMSAASAYSVDIRLMMAIMEQDSRFGTVGLAVKTLNPGNVGNDDSGNTRTYDSWQMGVTAVAEWLNRHRVSQETQKTTGETILEFTATSTPSAIPPTATTTTSTTTSTTLETAIPINSTSTPSITTTTSTTTPATTIQDILTPMTSTSTPTTATTTPPATTSTTTTATTIPVTSTVEESAPVVTSTSTVTTLINTATSTEATSPPQENPLQASTTQETTITTTN